MIRALRENRVVCLLADRDIAGDGMAVEFFGETTTLPGRAGDPGAADRRHPDPDRGVLPPAREALRADLPAAPRRAPGPPARGCRARDPGPRPPLRGARPHGARAVARDAAQLAERPRRARRVEPAADEVVGLMRVALLSPYSLSVPGGVQGQVLGLARALRAIGVDARVIGPTDGPPPEPGVTTVGPSVGVASNGSMVPLVADQTTASDRTLEALRVFDPDVLHLHEPLVPGPTSAALLGSEVPKVGTFHAASEDGSVAYKSLRKIAVSAAKRLAVRVAVSPDAREMAEDALGGSYLLLPNGVDVDAYAKVEPTPSDRPGGDVLRAPRAAQGTRRAARRVGRARPRRRALGRVRRTRDRGADGPAHPARGVARAGSPSRRSAPGSPAPPSSARPPPGRSRSASCCSRRWRPARACSPPTSRATGTSAVTT